MAKRLFDVLSTCQTEEEVKAEFAKYFKIKINTRYRIDLYTPHVLFEFKYNQNFHKTVYQNLSSIMWLDYRIELWDLGWWQIRMAAKDMRNAADDLNNLHVLEQALSVKIREQIPILGFTPPQVVPLSE